MWQRNSHVAAVAQVTGVAATVVLLAATAATSLSNKSKRFLMYYVGTAVHIPFTYCQSRSVVEAGGVSWASHSTITVQTFPIAERLD